MLEHDLCPPLTNIGVFSLTSVFCRHTHLVLSQSRSYLDYKVLALVWSSIVKGPPVVGEVKYRNGSGIANTDAERPNS